MFESHENMIASAAIVSGRHVWQKYMLHYELNFSALH